MQNQKVFELYKPFRNQVRKCGLLDSLYVIWGYARNLSLNKSFPNDIEHLPNFNPEGNIVQRQVFGIHDYEQEFLYKEFILHCDPNQTQYSLKKLKNQAKLIDYLRHNFNDKLIHITPIEDDILREFFRMAHLQFKWQKTFDNIEFVRYYRIFSQQDVRPYVEQALGFPIHLYFILGIIFYSFTANQFETNIQEISQVDFITNEMIEQFLGTHSTTLGNARETIKKHQQMNENLFYSYNPLYEKPILLLRGLFVCPMPQLLFMKMTGGIYYSINKLKKGFNNAFGNAFQEYIGYVMSKCLTQSFLNIYPEAVYGTSEKRTTDWILEDESAVLFIECKTKRLTQISKTEFNYSEGLEKDLRNMASFVIQVYKGFEDYSQNLYPQIKFYPTKDFIPLVVTMEEWYLGLSQELSSRLRGFIIEGLRNNNIDPAIIDKYPYHIMSCDEFEKDIQVINDIGLQDYFDKKEKLQLHEFLKGYPYRAWYRDDLKTLFLDPLKELVKT